jgi:hypothetical protein
MTCSADRPVPASRAHSARSSASIATQSVVPAGPCVVCRRGDLGRRMSVAAPRSHVVPLRERCRPRRAASVRRTARCAAPGLPGRPLRPAGLPPRRGHRTGRHTGPEPRAAGPPQGRRPAPHARATPSPSRFDRVQRVRANIHPTAVVRRNPQDFAKFAPRVAGNGEVLRILGRGRDQAGRWGWGWGWGWG